MDHDALYVFSGSSSVGDDSTIYSKIYKKKASVEYKARYKKSTIKRNFRKKKRKRRFNGKLKKLQPTETQPMEMQSMNAQSAKVLSSITQ